MSFVKITKRLTYANVDILLHLYVLKFASVGLTLARFTLTKCTGVPENYVLQLVLSKLIKKTSAFHDPVIIYIHISKKMLLDVEKRIL